MPLKTEQLTFTWQNRGIPGDLVFLMSRRFAADVLQLQPRNVVILAGVNDVINCLLNDFPYENGNIESCIYIVYDNIKAMCDVATKEIIKVFLASILPIETPMGKDIDNEQAKYAIEKINQMLATLAHEEGYSFIDYYPTFVDDNTGFLKKELTVDGVHLKKSAYKILFSILFRHLAEGEN